MEDFQRVDVLRDTKDRVFRMLFNDKKALLELYNAMNNSTYDEPNDLIITTLENAIYMGMKNDVSYVLYDQLFLYEHQSTVNPNMPLRDLHYVSELYSSIERKGRYNLYSSSLIKIPEPKFIVFYNGTADMPEYMKLKLSDAYIKKTDNPDLELTVHHYNINIGYNKELMERCKTLKEYMIFVGKTRELNVDGDYKKAIYLAVEECIKEGVLKEFLLKNKSEVIAMSIYEYDEKEYLELFKAEFKAEGLAEGLAEGHAEGRAKGRAEGLAEGRAEGLVEGRAEGRAEGLAEGEKIKLESLIKKKLAKGNTPEEIADILEEEISVIVDIINELQA